jgi:aminoglycoside phosphotransferase (APT) family kinase protein
MTPPESASSIPSAGAVDHAWLREHLGWSLTGREAVTVRSISLSGGVMASVHQVRCAGRSFILKGPPDETTAWGNLAADTGLIEREVMAYRRLQARGPTAPKIAPECYWSTLEAAGRGALALEDLGPPTAVAPTMAAGLGEEQAVAAVRCLALLHAGSAAAGSDPLTPPCPWLYSAASPGLRAAVRLGLDDLPRVMAQCWPGAVPDTRLRRVLAIDVGATLVRSHVGSRLTAVCHGDTWVGNILFSSRPEAAEPLTAHLVDWQFTMWGNPLSDLALLLWSSLTPESRRAWQEELLRLYHTTLEAHGDVEYPLNACRDDLTRALPGAALVALATLETYAAGMSPAQLARLRPRVLAAIDCAAVAST